MADIKFTGVAIGRAGRFFGTINFPSPDTETAFNADGIPRIAVGAGATQVLLVSSEYDVIKCDTCPVDAINCGIEA